MKTFYTRVQKVDCESDSMTDLQGYAKDLSRVALAAKNVETAKRQHQKHIRRPEPKNETIWMPWGMILTS